MFDLFTIIIIIVILFAIYYISSSNSSYIVSHIDKTKYLLESQIDDLNERISLLEQKIITPISDSNKKMRDLLSLQNKAIEVTKMNNQQIIHQINQYDPVRASTDIDDENQKNNEDSHIFNSVEQTPITDQNKPLFSKDTKNEAEQFYMSSDKSEKSTKSKKNDKSENISTTSSQLNTDNKHDFMQEIQNIRANIKTEQASQTTKSKDSESESTKQEENTSMTSESESSESKSSESENKIKVIEI